MKLLLIEDDQALAAGLITALTRSGYAVDHATRASDAVRLAQSCSYEGGVLDLGLPDRDGLELLRLWRAQGAAFPILILTARDAIDDRIRGLDAGADDYLIKPFALAELEARLRALFRRHDSSANAWRQIGALRVDLEGTWATIAGKPAEFTARELAVLTALMRRPGRTVNKEALFSLVFTNDAEATDNALEVHISRLRRKLEPAGLKIRGLRGLGYRIEESE